jgi:hypothetical protein
LAGYTISADYPVSSQGYDKTYNGGPQHYGDMIISRLDEDLTDLSASTFLGGSGADAAYIVSLDVSAAGDVYVSGATGSTDFPVTQDAFQKIHQGGEHDVFIALLDPQLSADPSLITDVEKITAATGGTVLFSLNAGPDHGGRDYLLFGTMSGTDPGILLPGGLATLPISWDPFTSLVYKLANSIFFVDFLGVLNGEGAATARLETNGPVDPAFVGVEMHFAYALLYAPWDFASNPVAILIDP